MTNPCCREKSQAGFTLIEVLAAVAVLAIALSAVLVSAASFTDNAVYLRDKAITALVARNVVVDYQLEPAWPEPGRKDGDMEMAGQLWPWETVVQKTDDPNLRRMDVIVFRPDGEQPVARLTAFLGASSGAAARTAPTASGTAGGVGN